MDLRCKSLNQKNIQHEKLKILQLSWLIEYRLAALYRV